MKPRGFLLLLACICLLTVGSVAQIAFQRTYGGDYFDWGRSMMQTADGGYIVAGHTESFGAGRDDVWLIRTDAYGDTIWTHTYGDTVGDVGWSVTQTVDGGYIITGWTESFGAGDFDVYLIKADVSGDTVWTRTYGGTDEDCGYSVAQTLDGGYIIAGHTSSFGAGNRDAWLIKTDALGDTLWTRTFGGTGWDEGYSVAQTTDNGYIIAGLTWSFGTGEGDAWLIKTDASGDTVWTRTYGGWDNGGDGRSVLQTADGGYVIAGTILSRGGVSEVWLIKTDAWGDTVWTRTHGGLYRDEGWSVAQTTDGGYVITGYTRSFGAGGADVWLIKTDASGDTMWTRTYGGINEDYGHSVQQTADGGYAIAGHTGSFGAGWPDVWLIKTDSAGRVAIAEPEPPVARKPAPATIVRAVLHMPETEMTNAQYPMILLDVAGRKAMDLRAGPNDVRHLSPGVYFVREASGVERQASSVRKVILTR